MHPVTVLFAILGLALAAPSAPDHSSAKIKIKLSGTTTDLTPVDFTATKPGSIPKGKFHVIEDIRKSTGSKGGQVVSVCFSNPKKGPAALIVAPELNFPNKKAKIHVQDSTGFEVVSSAGIEKTCPSKKASGISLKLFNSKKGAPLQAMLFREAEAHAIHKGFRRIQDLEIKNSNNEAVTVHLCKGKGKAVFSKVVNAKSSLEASVPASVGKFKAVDIIPESKKPKRKVCNPFPEI